MNGAPAARATRRIRRLRGRAGPILLGLALLPAGAALFSAELGDFNGDGRVSFADAYLVHQWVRGNPAVPPPAAGALDGYAQAFPCSSGGGLGSSSSLLLHEAARRAGPDPLPHFIESWPEPLTPPGAAPPADDRVRAEIAGAVHAGGGASLQIAVALSSAVPIEFLALVLGADGVVLRPPPPSRTPPVPRTTNQLHLLSGGLLCYYTPLGQPRDWEPGERALLLHAEIPRGTAPNRYRIEILPGSEAVAPGGEVIPIAGAPGILEIEHEVIEGHDRPLPPLRFADPGAREMAGSADFRFDGPPAIELSPGDEIAVTVQVRVGRPVNRLRAVVRYDISILDLIAAAPLLADEATGRLHPERFEIRSGEPHFGQVSITHAFPGSITGVFTDDDRQPSLDYIRPFDEWLDLVELRFRAVGSGRTPLALGEFPEEPSLFAPYLDRRPFIPGGDCERTMAGWTYRSSYGEASVTVRGDGEPGEPQPPLPPEAAGIRFSIGDAEGKPGAIVEVPVVLEGTEVPVSQLRLVLGFDAGVFARAGFQARLAGPGSEPRLALLDDARPDFINQECEGEGFQRVCRSGLPWIGLYRGPERDVAHPEGISIVDLIADHDGGFRTWTPGERFEIGSLRLRIADGVPGGAYEIAGARAEWTPRESIAPVLSSTAGFPVLDPPAAGRRDVPAIAVRPGRVTVLGESPEFLRADADGSGAIEITDAVRSLGALFLGDAAIGCLDAADANDDGTFDIADPVYTLDYLFLGTPAPAAPFPDPGPDPTADLLDCRG